jgi:hypothetical protein
MPATSVTKNPAVEPSRPAQAWRGDAHAPVLGPGGRPMPCDLEALLLPVEAAHLLALSIRTLEGLRLRGGGPPFVRLRRVIRYRRADLRAWVDARRHAP